LNFSREARADTETERGFMVSERLSYSRNGTSVTGFVNYTNKTPSLTGLIVGNPQLLPTSLQAAYAADPVHFLQIHGHELHLLLPGVELPLTRSLDTGLLLQTAFRRLDLSAEVRYSTGEVFARDQRSVLVAGSVGINLDAANSLRINASRYFTNNLVGSQSAVTISYVHRFGRDSGSGFQFARLFGFGRGKIQGRVFSDLNSNGQDDAGEPGLPGMTVQIDGTRTATTDASGRFQFKSDPGEYSVALISPELGRRLRASSPTERQVSLSSGQTADLSFGLSDLGMLGGRVVNDLLLTGGPATSDLPGVGGLRLTLRPTAGHRIPDVSAVADARGHYQFLNLAPGSYNVELDPRSLPPNYRLPERTAWLVVIQPLGNFNLDIALAAQRAITGTVFVDRDGDGQFDPQKDEVVVGARVSAGKAFALSGPGGTYVLRNLPAGKIEVFARAPDGVDSLPFSLELLPEPVTQRGVNLIVLR
jgi:hypothetical protein